MTDLREQLARAMHPKDGSPDARMFFGGRPGFSWELYLPEADAAISFFNPLIAREVEAARQESGYDPSGLGDHWLVGKTLYVRSDLADDKKDEAVAAARKDEREKCARVARLHTPSSPDPACEAFGRRVRDDISAAILARTGD